MLLNKTNLLNTTTAFNTVFNTAFAGYAPTWATIAMEAPSTTGSNDYRWLGKLKGMREWIGERDLGNLEQSGYTVRNKHFENTVEVDRDDFEDDQIGLYTPMFADLGQTAAEHPDQLVFNLFRNADSTVCYDGQNFADTDHPVRDVAGAVQSVSNFGGGAGEMWGLLVTNRPVKPFIYQPRKKAQFVALDNPDDPTVFLKNKLLYGVDGRWNAGVGLWQLAFFSRDTLNADNYAAARAAIMAFTGDGGRPLNLSPNLLVVGGGNEGKGRQIVKNQNNAAGATNEWVGTADLFVSPLLTGA